MTIQTRLVTAKDLLNLPDDGYRYELIRGELRKMPPSEGEHGLKAFNVTLSLGQYVKANNLGKVFVAETGFKLTENPDTVRAPDVAFISRERAEPFLGTRGFWPLAPDLVVEVISPSDRYTEVEEKVREWLGHGTRMVLVANPRQRTVTVYTQGVGAKTPHISQLTDSDQLDGAEVIPGWAMPVADVFA